MTRRLITLLAVALVVRPIAAPGAPHVLAIRCGATLADASRPALRDATIIIADGTITEVGTGPAIPAGAAQLDLRSYTVMPGLVDAHAHL